MGRGGGGGHDEGGERGVGRGGGTYWGGEGKRNFRLAMAFLGMYVWDGMSIVLV